MDGFIRNVSTYSFDDISAEAVGRTGLVRVVGGDSLYQFAEALPHVQSKTILTNFGAIHNQKWTWNLKILKILRLVRITSRLKILKL
jgi:hypothetical protein